MLSFCLNAFPCGSLEELRHACFVQAAAVRERFNALTDEPGAVFYPGLWLGQRVAAALAGDGAELDAFAAALAAAGMAVTTLNAFPYDVFHGQEVKTRVYVPDWAAPERLRYTLDCARVLARLLLPGAPGSISTVPVGYGPRGAAGGREFPEERLAPALANLRAVANAFADIMERGGPAMRLALEPEPDCLLDDAPSVRGFYRRLRESAASAAEAARIENHIGVCLDTAHAAARFDDSAAMLAALTADGIPVWKAQFACALETEIDAGTAERLRPYNDRVYLHQNAWLRPGDAAPVFGRDLPEALTALADAAARPGGVLRAHYHLPFTVTPPPGIRAVGADFPAGFFPALRRAGCRDFEVEVYTLGLLTPAAEIPGIFAADMDWLRRRMDADR